MSITHVFNIWTIPENYLNISTCNRESVFEWHDVTIYVGRDQIYHNYKSPSGVIGYDHTRIWSPNTTQRMISDSLFLKYINNCAMLISTALKSNYCYTITVFSLKQVN